MRDHIDSTYKRLIRIEGQIDIPPTGKRINVYDHETNNLITNIMSMTIHIDALNVTEAEITYIPFDENGEIKLDDSGNPIEETVTVPDIKMQNIMAFEIGKEAHATSE